MQTNKKLTRDVDNKVIAGVVAGLANYFGHDATLWRLGAVLLILATGFFPGVLLYVVAWVLMPPASAADNVTYTVNE